MLKFYICVPNLCVWREGVEVWRVRWRVCRISRLLIGRSLGFSLSDWPALVCKMNICGWGGWNGGLEGEVECCGG